MENLDNKQYTYLNSLISRSQHAERNFNVQGCWFSSFIFALYYLNIDVTLHRQVISRLLEKLKEEELIIPKHSAHWGIGTLI